MLEAIQTSFQYGQHQVTLETGEIARQATGAVKLTMGETVILATAVAHKDVKEGQDFFPLTINYQEKTYAAGKIPGGFLKREGRPSDKETLIARLIDRPLRPLFPKGFYNEIQVIVTVLALDEKVGTEIPAMLAASAALAISGVPFMGPIGAAKVGYVEGEYVLNPSSAELENSDLDLSVAGTTDAVLMVESEASGLPEDVMLKAVMFGHEHMQVSIDAINEFKSKAGKEAWDWSAPEVDEELANAVKEQAESALTEAYQIQDKMARYDAVGVAKSAAIEALVPEDESGQWSQADVEGQLAKLEKSIVRGRILNGTPRIDGRALDDVRQIECKVGVLPKVHGSALFTRGETQALVVTTLGTEKEAQMIDDIEGFHYDNFIFHYNFPPFSVGETGRVGAPGRREIGHGRLAKRGVNAVVPKGDDFPYVLRVVSEITESNGSSSMASVCGSSMAMMHAGVPLSAPVAGIAMGLVKEGDQFAVLSDILGDEDHLGDMDFKVAGTEDGITALQMDIKITGITEEIMQIALEQAKGGRLHILGEMAKAISKPNTEMNGNAPRFIRFKIAKDKIGMVIGKGGSTIREITEKFGVEINIGEEGDVTISTTDGEQGAAAQKMIEDLTADIEVDTVYEGKVEKIVDFGAFVSILSGQQGLLHISEIAQERVENVSDYLSEGDTVKVKVLEVKDGRIRLSKKQAEM